MGLGRISPQTQRPDQLLTKHGPITVNAAPASAPVLAEVKAGVKPQGSGDTRQGSWIGVWLERVGGGGSFVSASQAPLQKLES